MKEMSCVGHNNNLWLKQGFVLCRGFMFQH